MHRPTHHGPTHSTPPRSSRCGLSLRASALLVAGACSGGACSGGDAARGARTESQAFTYSLHEWGVVSVGQTFTELAAGPGLRRGEPDAFRHRLRPGDGQDPEPAVEKPVVYVHADGPVELTLTIGTGPGYEIAERWPEQGSSLSWSARASGQPCAEPTPYPTGCTSLDGYCEALELASYTTDDSSCLAMGDINASLIFYRLRAAADQGRASLPVQVYAAANDGNGGVFEVSATSPRSAWRVRHDAGGRVLVQRFEIGTGPSLVPGADSPDAASAAAWTTAELRERGLTESEVGAFQNAWWQEIFRIEPTVSVHSTGASAGGAEEHPAEERHVQPSEDQEEAFPPSPTLVREMFIYFLTAEEVNTIAVLDATPAPSATHRAFMVRHYLD